MDRVISSKTTKLTVLLETLKTMQVVLRTLSRGRPIAEVSRDKADNAGRWFIDQRKQIRKARVLQTNQANMMMKSKNLQKSTYVVRETWKTIKVTK